MTAIPEYCTYPYCPCIVSTTTAKPAPTCPHGLETPASASYGIMASRAGGSVMGAARAWLKAANGKAKLFATLDAAAAEANRLNDWVSSPHISYRAQRFQ
jgi:hypothetical protein